MSSADTTEDCKLLASTTGTVGSTLVSAAVISARMLNEFVYCPRLFYYEFVEGVFVENADTLRGSAIHTHVDSGSGALPPTVKAEGKGEEDEGGDSMPRARDQRSVKTSKSELPNPASESPPETIHSRSVQMGSHRLGVTAKMDLVEARTAREDLFSALEVCPVDYKAGGASGRGRHRGVVGY